MYLVVAKVKAVDGTTDRITVKCDSFIRVLNVMREIESTCNREAGEIVHIYVRNNSTGG